MSSEKTRQLIYFYETNSLLWQRKKQNVAEEHRLVKAALRHVRYCLASFQNSLHLVSSETQVVEDILDFIDLSIEGHSVCGSCHRQDGDDGSDWIECSLCNIWVHASCAQIDADSVKGAVEWLCDFCNSNSNSSPRTAKQITAANAPSFTTPVASPKSVVRVVQSQHQLSTSSEINSVSEIKSADDASKNGHPKKHVQQLRIWKQKRKNVILCDSQGKTMHPFVLDPAKSTKILTFKGLEIKKLAERLAATKQPANNDVEKFVLFAGGIGLNHMNSNLDSFIFSLQVAFAEIKRIFPKAELFLTSVLPRTDCKLLLY